MNKSYSQVFRLLYCNIFQFLTIKFYLAFITRKYTCQNIHKC